jgi:anti-sigma-K factor RskA
MDASELLDYALGQLEGSGRDQIEREIAHDPELAGRVARLIRNLRRLLDDGIDPRRPDWAPSPQWPGGSAIRRFSGARA